MKAQQRLSESTQLPPRDHKQFIPNLCQINAVLLMLILTQLFALVISLSLSGKLLLDWGKLGLISIYSQSIVMSCAAIICISMKWLKPKPARIMAFYCMSIILLITAAYSSICGLWLNESIIGDASTFMLRSILISTILGALLLRYFYLQYQWQEQKQAELNSRLEALQARIRPHFLFNSMNSIASLIALDPQRAEDAVLDLSSLFRATLNNDTMLISMKEEIALCRRYLNIESLRLGDRLTLEWEVLPEVEACLIPPLSLQPLFENAIYHGIQPLKEGGTVRIESYLKNHTVYVLISNPFDPKRSHHEGNRIALDNIKHRFTALFGGEAVLKTSQLDATFTVTLRFPVKRQV